MINLLRRLILNSRCFHEPPAEVYNGPQLRSSKILLIFIFFSGILRSGLLTGATLKASIKVVEHQGTGSPDSDDEESLSNQEYKV